jgi:hypothetical protein
MQAVKVMKPHRMHRLHRMRGEVWGHLRGEVWGHLRTQTCSSAQSAQNRSTFRTRPALQRRITAGRHDQDHLRLSKGHRARLERRTARERAASKRRASLLQTCIAARRRLPTSAQGLRTIGTRRVDQRTKRKDSAGCLIITAPTVARSLTSAAAAKTYAPIAATQSKRTARRAHAPARSGASTAPVWMRRHDHRPCRHRQTQPPPPRHGSTRRPTTMLRPDRPQPVDQR